MTASILRVAVNAPLPTLFDYLPPANGPLPVAGSRVLVPFGRRREVGVVMETAQGSDVPYPGCGPPFARWMTNPFSTMTQCG